MGKSGAGGCKNSGGSKWKRDDRGQVGRNVLVQVATTLKNLELRKQVRKLCRVVQWRDSSLFKRINEILIITTKTGKYKYSTR